MSLILRMCFFFPWQGMVVRDAAFAILWGLLAAPSVPTGMARRRKSAKDKEAMLAVVVHAICPRAGFF